MSSFNAQTSRADLGPDAFDALLVRGTPLLDVRAPVEFARGSVPGSANLPLLFDEERAQVGTEHRQSGPAAAVALGHELVCGAVRDERVEGWSRWCAQHAQGVLLCARGGARSGIAQDWLAAAGHRPKRVRGGYKALRAHLTARMHALTPELDVVVLGGRSGSGKTAVLERFERSIYFEGLAHHRGSAFGARLGGQPTLANFENRLALRMLRLTESSDAPILVEDESRNVGRLTMPRPLYDHIKKAPLVLVEASLDERVTTTLRSYILDSCREHQEAAGDERGFENFGAQLHDSLDRIRRRLGGDRHAYVRGLMADALARHRARGETDAHRPWIRALLSEYYDPRYDYEVERNAARIAYRGDADGVCAWLEGHGVGRAR